MRFTKLKQGEKDNNAQILMFFKKHGVDIDIKQENK